MTIEQHFSETSALRSDEIGTGPSILLLHGGGGVDTVRGLGHALAEQARVLIPTHPGFDGTVRPRGLDSVLALAGYYLQWLAQRGLTDVVVVGSSLGGWVAAEMALQDSGRLRGMVLINAVGIQTPDAAVVDISGYSREALLRLAAHDPERMLAHAPAMTPERHLLMISNAAALAAYDNGAAMMATGLRERLAGVTFPVAVVWGRSDGIAPVAYGRAYAAAFPNGRFEMIAEAGHLPHIEQPSRVLNTIRRFLNEPEARDAGRFNPFGD